MTAQELQTLLDILNRNRSEGRPTVADMRAEIAKFAAFLPAPDDIATEQIDAGGVPAEFVAAPGADADRVVLYLHGGGYVMGGPDSHRTLAAGISRAAAARCLVLDYRLAPEHPFPAPVEDAVTGYRWLLAQGVAPARLVMAGDSAGGGLAVAALVKARDEGLPLPAAAVCLSPWTDMEGLGESVVRNADKDPMVQREGLLALAELYLDGADPHDPLAAPLYADLAGLPPLLIQAGADEVLLSDAARLAERARAAGVAVSYEAWPDMFHVWQLFAPMLSEGREAIERIGGFIREHTG